MEEELSRLSPDDTFFGSILENHHAPQVTPEKTSKDEAATTEQITSNGASAENVANATIEAAAVTPSKRPRFFQSPSPDPDGPSSVKSGDKTLLGERQTPDPQTPSRLKNHNHSSSSKHPALSPSSPRLSKKGRLTHSPGSLMTPTKRDVLDDQVENLRPCESQHHSTTHHAFDHAGNSRMDVPLPAPLSLKDENPLPFSPGAKPDLSLHVELPVHTDISDEESKPKLESNTDSKPNIQPPAEPAPHQAPMDEDCKPNIAARPDVKPVSQLKPSSPAYIDLTSSPDSPGCYVISKKIKHEDREPSCPPTNRQSQSTATKAARPSQGTVTQAGRPSQGTATQADRPSQDHFPSWEKKYIGAFMCEGYMIYSSAKLREGEEIWLSRSSANEVKKTPKSVSAKKEDHVVRFESKKNGTFARLNESYAKWIVKLIDQRLVTFEGKLLFPPAKSTIGSTVHCYLKAYLLRSAFVSPNDSKFDSLTNLQMSKLAHFFNAPEAGEDKERVDRQQSINTLFGAINLMASSCSTAALKLASRTTAGSSKTPTDIKRDPDAEGEMDQSNIDLVYQKATAHDMSLDMRSPCEGFELPLRPYQQQGLSWLMKMEGNCEEAREEVSIHPLWEEYIFPRDEEQADWTDPLEEKFYYNPYMGELSFQFPRASRKCQGGILADEMGLGKTIQMAALICTARPPHYPLSKSESDDEEDGDGIDKKPIIKAEDDIYKKPLIKAEDDIDKKPKIRAQEDSVPEWQSILEQHNAKEKQSLRKSHATLVVCPLTLLDQWKDELERCHKALKVFVYHSATKGTLQGNTDKYDVVITTYNIVASEWGTIASKSGVISKLQGLFKIDWFRIILDEGHNIKNRNAHASKACYNISGRRRWVLSGTPIVNRLEDLSSLLHFIRLEPWGHFSFYRSFVTVPFSKKDPKALVVVQTIIESVLLRREKRMKDLDGKPIVPLPPKHINLAYLDLNRKERMIYDMVYENAKSEYMEFLGQGTLLSNVTAILAILMRLRQAVLHPMLVLKKMKISDSRSADDVKKVDKMLKEYENAPSGSFASNQWKDLEKKLKGNKSDGEVADQECVMCLDVMDSRVYLPCMHAFCKDCTMTYIENKAGEETICPTCSEPFQETGIIEYVMGRAKNTSNPSSGPSTPSGPSSALQSEDEAPDEDTKPTTIKTESHPKSSREMIDLDYEIPIENIPKSISDDDEGLGGGYLKRNDFISSTKLEALTDHLIKARRTDPGFSAVVFSQFTGFLDLIEQVLKRDKFRFVRLDGTLSTRKRKKALETFNDPRRPCILVCSLKVAGVGLNLIKANRVYMMDTWWNEAIENQAIDRIHRFGQEKPTYVVRFLVRNSIEDRMLAIQKNKRAIINDALGGNKNSKAGQAQTLEDLKAIFAD
ncbi:hypothetical protein PCANC_15420 [Puccinia coronata f. sp. avenae]|uniref:DNA repair protein RAD5 n=1 Tax=Puccinia coronata f. sp. avenae TaxID=200324 RepID=A0A2N5SWL5_9BASI|nr:hypothetical protein PCANC_15420 [Puccinia coronata f. sp. avenae]